MKKLIFILMVGSLFAQDDNFIYFKPTGWVAEQGVEKYKILSVILSDGTIIFDNNNHSLRPTWSYNKPKDPFKAGLLSIFFPSGGHYYNEEYEKGLMLFGITIGTLVGGTLALISEPVIGGIFLLASPAIHYASTVNAIKSSQKINELYYKEFIHNQNTKSESN